MPPRNLVPLVLLTVLGFLALAFAIFGASSAPSGASLTVQNGSSATFGMPTGSNSFTMDLVASVSAGSGTQAVSQVRQIRYAPPASMVVSQVTPASRGVARLSPAAISCALASYTAIVGGSTPWTPSGNAYVRTESVADYSARVPTATATSCSPEPTTVQGSVHERASVRSGYLVGVRLTIKVPPQRLSNGTAGTSGTEGEALVVLSINGQATRHLGS
ncbi:MAG TPA: hypothetical protein VMF35_04365 [Acidimicrobiales bacterium]|nr:hypothetical protein [Acidimicrobiales bacterium]